MTSPPVQSALVDVSALSIADLEHLPPALADAVLHTADREDGDDLAAPFQSHI